MTLLSRACARTHICLRVHIGALHPYFIALRPQISIALRSSIPLCMGRFDLCACTAPRTAATRSASRTAASRTAARTAARTSARTAT
eukprot:1214271-Pleurochrysis_carterae.AAC.5